MPQEIFVRGGIFWYITKKNAAFSGNFIVFLVYFSVFGLFAERGLNFSFECGKITLGEFETFLT